MSCQDDHRQRVMRVSVARREPVLLHIQDAESWLSRAKTEYQTANDVRGELDLSLAQAEVKYAWELSRSKRRTATVLPAAKRTRARWMLPLAACLGLGIWAAITLPRLVGRQPEGPVAVRPRPAAVTPPPQSTVIPKAPSPQKPPATTDRPTAVPPTAPEQSREETPSSPSVSPAPTAPVAVEPETPSRVVVPPAESVRPASTGSGADLDLDELARVAQETLTSGESVNGGQH